ncbi:MAG TPA: DUF4136 domain-containing protein [Vicinamibacterales bacterium]|nr:DUF4136 domain-containing protein [Vicinamibacterales bacterium]
MQLSRISLGVGVMMLLAGAAFAQKVTTDHAKDANFGQYKTFMWIKEPKTSDPLKRQRIVDDVNSALSSKGLKLVTSDADLAIAAHASTQQERTLQTFYDGFGGGWRWGGGFGSATTTANTYDVGTLVVDLFDARTKEAVWRGSATKTLSENPQKNEKSLNKAIAKMFTNFPPSKSS